MIIKNMETKKFLKMAQRTLDRMRAGRDIHEDFIPPLCDYGYSDREKYLFNFGLFLLSQYKTVIDEEYNLHLRR